MSPLWRDHLRIGVCPDRLILTGYRRGLRPAIAVRRIIPVESSPDAAHWQAAVDSLPSALALTKRGKTEITVILSNHFVRYALLPWNATLKTEAEWLALARHRLASVHGRAADDWSLRISQTARQGPRLVSAADKALLDALGARIAEGGARLASVQPYLMAAFNRLRPRVGNESCWLVIVEPGRLTLALIEHGAWRAIRSRRIDAGWPTTLPEILERESAVLALEQPCTQVIVYTQEAFDANTHGAFRVRDLTLAAGSPSSDRTLAMALG